MERLISVDELSSGETTSVFVDDIPALVARVDDEFFVIEDVCSHDGQPLEGGEVAEGAIRCPRHGARFDLRTGKALCMPATRPVRSFYAEVREGAVWAASKAPEKATDTAAAVNTRVLDQLPSDGTQSPDLLSIVNSDNCEVPPLRSPEAEPEIVDADGNPKQPTTETEWLEALRQVIDPELMVNIVDLGLVYSVSQDPEKPGRVRMDMTLTSPACPAGPQLVQQSRMALERLHDVSEAAITMVMSPPWTPERMTDEARDQLGIF